MKKLLSGLIALFMSITVSATHFSGGELRYEFNGINYTIEVALYQACEPSQASLPATADVVFNSNSTSNNFQRTLPQVSNDTFSAGCGGTNTCNSPFSTFYGYIVKRYRDTVMLPVPAADWVFSYMNGARSAGYSNLLNGSSSNMYLEATLDNTIAENSSAWIPNAPGYYVLNNVTNTIPLQTLDAEGDGIVYELITPLMAPATPMNYSSGYSFINPLGSGGIYAINATSQTMSVKTTSTGKFGLAFRVKEYRNSVLVGSYIRDFMIFSPPANTTMTYAAPSSLAPFTVYTCPGQSHSLSLSFTDPTATDSVVSVINTPSIPGFTFSNSVTNGIGSGAVNISWTTPLSMNPAILPFFYIKLRVRDGGCPKALADYAIIVRTKQCGPDSVWPGDANGDYTVNVYDPLAIAVAMGQAGPARISPTTSWVPQACAMWPNAFVFNNVNMKHADCDGNGIVTTADLAAITANYGLTHPKTGGDEKQTAGPILHFDFTGLVAEPGTIINIPIMLGDAGNAISSFYGLGTRIGANIGGVSTPMNVSATSSWLGTSTNTLNFNKNTAPNSVDWAHARTDNQNQSGHGVIGTLTFAVPAGAVRGSYIDFTFNDTKLIDKDGNDITSFSIENGSLLVPFPQNVHELPKGLMSVGVLPNPSHNSAALQLILENAVDVNLRVVDMLGKTIWQTTERTRAGNNSIILPAQQLAAGMYTIHVQADGWNSSPVVKWLKQ